MMNTRAELEAELIARVTDDDAFRARLLENPRDVIREATGMAIPEGFAIHVHEENATTAHVVLPQNGELTREELAVVSGGFGAFWG